MTDAVPELIGTGPRMRAVFDRIAQIAACGAHVLITGESGTGKQTLARAIHAASVARRPGPFVPFHCGALLPTLVESELFSHVKYTFARPGQPQIRPGAFEKARGGTLLLNLVEEVPFPLQTHLLYALRNQRIRRVGGDEVGIDVRVIAETCCDLTARVREGVFRDDLYYRLSVVHLHLPPLRERSEDIPRLAIRFAAEHTRPGGAPLVIGQEALQALVGYAWPGNVRELKNVIERGWLLARGGVIRPADLPASITGT
jgi:two-component system response regulator AtoC